MQSPKPPASRLFSVGNIRSRIIFVKGVSNSGVVVYLRYIKAWVNGVFGLNLISHPDLFLNV